MLLKANKRNVFKGLTPGKVRLWSGPGVPDFWQSLTGFQLLLWTLRWVIADMFSVCLENHRLESSYQNHLVLKVLVVSEMSYPQLSANCTLYWWECSLSYHHLTSHNCLNSFFSLVQLLQLFRVALLHCLCHAGHGASQTGRSASFVPFLILLPIVLLL